MFVWKRQIFDENTPKDILFKRINQDQKIDQEEIETLYEDARANKAKGPTQ
jgi:hypothetical protein